MWYSKAFGGKVEEHKQKIWAISRCNFAASDHEPVEALGVYRRDPRKHTDEPNLLPGLIEKVRAKKIGEQLRAMMRQGRRAR